MRHVPHPLMIITAGNGHHPKKAGMLVSSFNTVTLSPNPIVTFNIKLPSSTYSAIEETGYFSITAPASAEQAMAYSKGLGALLSADSPLKERINQNSTAEFQASSAFQMQCQWLKEKSIEIGDHMVMVGQVLSLQENGLKTEESRVLIYSNGQYRYAGAPLKP